MADANNSFTTISSTNRFGVINILSAVQSSADQDINVHDYPARENIETTRQIQNENNQKAWFLKRAETTFGLRPIKEWNSAENKTKNSDADFTVEIADNTIHPAVMGFNVGDLVDISLKTKGGTFTYGNFGTQLNAALFKILVLSEEEKELLKTTHKSVLALRNQLKQYGRWKDVPNNKEEKKKIKNIYIDAFLTILSNTLHIDELFEFVNARISPLKLCGEDLILASNYNIAEKTATKMENNDGSIKIGNLILRFKSAGGKADSGWKINLEKLN